MEIWMNNQEAAPAQGSLCLYENTMFICLTGEQDGFISHYNLRRTIPFHHFGELLWRLDEICGLLGTPERQETYRTLKKRRGIKHEPAFAGLPAEYGETVTTKDRLQEGSFAGSWEVRPRQVLQLYLVRRDHLSLQGGIRGKLTGGEWICFRSALELLHLLTDAEEMTAYDRRGKRNEYV